MKQIKIIWILALMSLIASGIALALQVPNIGDYDNDGDYDFVMSEIVQNQDNETFYEMNAYYNITPRYALYGFFIDLNQSNDYLDVYLIYENHSNKLLSYNGSYFIDITDSAGVGGSADDPVGANTADFDYDGNADLFANNRLYLGYGNGSFVDVTNESNLAELPRLSRVIVWDFNEDNVSDILGLHENGTEVVIMLNMGDNNNDGIPEFWDASTLSRLAYLTKTELSQSRANSIASGWQWNHTYNSTNETYLVSGIYLPRNGTDILLDTYFSSKFTGNYTFAGIPEFRWLNISELFSGNLTYIMGNSTDAVYADLDNNTVDDLVISGSLTVCYADGSAPPGYYVETRICSGFTWEDPYGEGIDGDTDISLVSVSMEKQLTIFNIGKAKLDIDPPGTFSEDEDEGGGG